MKYYIHSLGKVIEPNRTQYRLVQLNVQARNRLVSAQIANYTYERYSVINIIEGPA